MVKEVSSYEEEVVTNEARVQKMRDDGKDSYGKKIYFYLPTLLIALSIPYSSSGPRHQKARGGTSGELHDDS